MARVLLCLLHNIVQEDTLKIAYKDKHLCRNNLCNLHYFHQHLLHNLVFQGLSDLQRCYYRPDLDNNIPPDMVDRIGH